MTALVFGLGLAVALSAAVRSTWSPCGRSMLSTITPIGERGRGHRFSATAAWFVIGGSLGGLCLGALGAVLAVAVESARPSPRVIGATALAVLLVAAALDARIGGLELPIHRRQVNERWLDRYRSGVYGLGFGWQIGTGVATYIMTAGVYLVVVLGALTARPWDAVAMGGTFGAIRGLAVLLGRGLRTPQRLSAFHRRFDELGGVSRQLVVVTELACAAAATVMLGVPPAAAAAAAAFLAVSVPLAGGRGRASSRRRSGDVGTVLAAGTARPDES